MNGLYGDTKRRDSFINNQETRAFQIVAPDVSTKQLKVIDSWVTLAKNKGYWQYITECAFFVGSTLTSRLKKFKTYPGTSQDLTNTSCTLAANFSAKGLVGNGTGYVNTNIPIAGMTKLSVSMGAFVTYQKATYSSLRGLMAASYGATGDLDRFYILDESTESIWRSFGLGSLYPSDVVAGNGLHALCQKGTGATDAAFLGKNLLTTYAGNRTWQKTGTILVNAYPGYVANGSSMGFYFVGLGGMYEYLQELNKDMYVCQGNLGRL